MKYSGMNDKTEVYKDEPTSCRKCALPFQTASHFCTLL